MATYSDAAQRRLDQEFERAEARREEARERLGVATYERMQERTLAVARGETQAIRADAPMPWVTPDAIASTFQFPGDGLAIFHPRYGLRMTQEDARPWVQMDAQTAERFAEWLRGQVRAAEDAVVRTGRLDVV